MRLSIIAPPRPAPRGRLAVLSLALAAVCSACGAPDSTESPTQKAPSAVALATCVTLVRGASDVADATVTAEYPSYAAGMEFGLWTGPWGGHEHLSLLRFDLGAIPPGAAVTSAQLDLYESWSSVYTQVDVHPILVPWAEPTVTYGSLSSGPPPWSPSPSATFSAGGVGHRLVDLTALVESWVHGEAPNQGVVLRETAGGHYYFSSESSSIETRPSLHVCYAEAPSTPPTAPVLRRPVRGNRLGSIFKPGSRRPVFQWSASTVMGGGPIQYELQYTTDPSFASAVTISTGALTHQPIADLTVSNVAPVGARYFYRARACAGAACSPYSTAWYVDIARSEHDLNGDGYADIAVGSPRGASGDGAVAVYFGAGGGPDSVADGTLTGDEAGSDFGRTIAPAGDVNGDGFSDLLVGAPLHDGGAIDGGAVLVYHGGPGSTFDATPDAVLSAASDGETLGLAIAGAGDINGDGYADIVVGAPRSAQGGPDSGAATVYFGGPTGIDPGTKVVLPSSPGDRAGASVALPIDLNGDGFADVAVGAPGSGLAGPASGAVRVFFGGPSLDTGADAVWTGLAAGDTFGGSLSAGDVHGDGLTDLLAGAPFESANGRFRGASYLFSGSEALDSSATSDATFPGQVAFDQFGLAMSAGDVNGDGAADLLIGAPFSDPIGSASGSALLFLGGGADPVATFLGVAPFDRFGLAVSCAGDVDGDGFSDLVVGAPGNRAEGPSTGAAYLYLGGAPPDATADLVLKGSSPGQSFGAAVF